MTRSVLATRPPSCPGALVRDRSEIQLVRSAIRVKPWSQATPTTDEVRPAHCPGCGAASREVGRSLTLWGHGLRDRQVRGPLAPGDPPTLMVVAVRRFTCRRCGTTCTVAPAEVQRGRLFSKGAIAWAVALFGLCRRSPVEVRRRVSPWASVGPSAARGWVTLRRWISTIATGGLFASLGPLGGGTLRDRAQRIASTLAGHCPVRHSGEPLDHQTFHGAVCMA